MTKIDKKGTGLFKRKKELVIKTLSEEIQKALQWEGAYDLGTGVIELGCLEKYTEKVFNHEYLHKFLFENIDMEAGIMLDNIARKLDLFLYNDHDIKDEIPYIFSLPPKRAKSFEHKHKTLEEKNLSPEIKETFEIGLTTYKSGKIDNYKLESRKITKVIQKELIPKLKNVKILKVTPVIGYWQGNKEPSVNIKINGNVTQQIINELERFKQKYNQDSVLIVQEKGNWTKLVITGIPELSINELGFEGLTYDFSNDKIFVLGEKFDFPEIRKKIRNMHGRIHAEKVGVKFL